MTAAAADRFAEELRAEQDPERKQILAAAVRLLRREPLRAPADKSLGTVKALATESGIGRFQLAHPERGRHYALAQRFVQAAADPDAVPAVEQRLREEKRKETRRADNAAADLKAAERRIEMMARAIRVLTAENERLRDRTADGPAAARERSVRSVSPLRP